MDKNKAQDLLREILHDLESLRFKDLNHLDAIVRRIKLVIEKSPGISSGYLTDLMSSKQYTAYGHSLGENMWNGGRNQLINLINTIIEDIQLDLDTPQQEVSELPKKAVTSNKVFIVHGHDLEMKQSVARIVEKLDLNPIILHEKPNEGRTVIEKFTEYSDVGFAIVLLSPDDKGCKMDDFPEKAMLRARQNVILELGFFLGKLGRGKVLALHKTDDNFEMPSDYSGVLYTPYDEGGAWQRKLVQELKVCGYDVDANKLY